MKKELKFNVTLSEKNCPGVMAMTEDQVKESAIKLIKIKSGTILPLEKGLWLTRKFKKNGGAFLIETLFKYDIDENK